MTSPYSFLTQDFFTTLNQYFVEIFNLAAEYQYEDVNDGDRYGIISFRSFEPTRGFLSGDNVRGGFKLITLRFDILLTLGSGDRLTTEATALSGMLDLHDGLPALKDFFPNEGLINDLKTEENFACVKRQSRKPPHNWIVDITCEATANLAIEIDQTGRHLMR